MSKTMKKAERLLAKGIKKNVVKNEDYKKNVIKNEGLSRQWEP